MCRLVEMGVKGAATDGCSTRQEGGGSHEQGLSHQTNFIIWFLSILIAPVLWFMGVINSHLVHQKTGETLVTAGDIPSIQ